MMRRKIDVWVDAKLILDIDEGLALAGFAWVCVCGMSA